MVAERRVLKNKVNLVSCAGDGSRTKSDRGEEEEEGRSGREQKQKRTTNKVLRGANGRVHDVDMSTVWCLLLGVKKKGRGMEE